MSNFGKIFIDPLFMLYNLYSSHDQQRCNICHQTICSADMLKRHMVLVHKKTKGAFLCSMCPKSCFFSRSTYEKHYREKHGVIEVDSDE